MDLDDMIPIGFNKYKNRIYPYSDDPLDKLLPIGTNIFEQDFD
jgi:hypothetical protein